MSSTWKATTVVSRAADADNNSDVAEEAAMRDCLLGNTWRERCLVHNLRARYMIPDTPKDTKIPRRWSKIFSSNQWMVAKLRYNNNNDGCESYQNALLERVWSDWQPKISFGDQSLRLTVSTLLPMVVILERRNESFRNSRNQYQEPVSETKSENSSDHWGDKKEFGVEHGIKTLWCWTQTAWQRTHVKHEREVLWND